MNHPAGDTTEDTLLRGQVHLVQPRRGFRSSLDPVLLAGFLAAPYGRVLDIGAGTGAVGFLLLARDPSATSVGLELQPRLARCLRLGVERNGWGARYKLHEGDARTTMKALAPGGFDTVVTNPPFLALGAAVLPPDEERALAHHEVGLRLREWVMVAAHALAPGGRLGVVFPAARTRELVEALAAAGLTTTRRRDVLTQPGQPPRRVLVEARWDRAKTEIEPPLLIHDGGGYGAEVRGMLGEA